MCFVAHHGSYLRKCGCFDGERLLELIPSIELISPFQIRATFQCIQVNWRWNAFHSMIIWWNYRIYRLKNSNNEWVVIFFHLCSPFPSDPRHSWDEEKMEYHECQWSGGDFWFCSFRNYNNYSCAVSVYVHKQ